jgi:hypothetical protein
MPCPVEEHPGKNMTAAIEASVAQGPNLFESLLGDDLASIQAFGNIFLQNML